jgi:hypothetical protein
MAQYRIIVRGRLSERFARTFDGFALEGGSCGETVLVGNVADQSQLYGVIGLLRDFGLELIRVEEEAR